jgi:hypothetical protein
MLLANIRWAAHQPALAIFAYCVLSLSGMWGIALMWRRNDRAALVVLILVAIAARSPLIAKAPFLSSDIYRYLWDGRELLAGYDPYVMPPNSHALGALQQDWLYRYVDWTFAPTIYPPLDLAFFALADKLDDSGLVGIKSLVELGDFAALGLLIAALRRRGLPAGRAALYGWSPLVIVEFAWSGHEEVWCVAALAAAVMLYDKGGRVASALALAGATLVKLYPLALLPAFFPRRPWIPVIACVAAVLAGYLPFLAWDVNVLGFLRAFATGFHFNDTLFGVLGAQGSLAVFGLCLTAAFVARQRGAGLVQTLVVLILGYFLLAPSVYPWYLTVFTVLVPLLPSRADRALRPLMAGIVGWTMLAIFGYAAEASLAARIVEYAPLAIGGAFCIAHLAQRRSAPEFAYRAAYAEPPLSAS